MEGSEINTFQKNKKPVWHMVVQCIAGFFVVLGFLDPWLEEHVSKRVTYTFSGCLTKAWYTPSRGSRAMMTFLDDKGGLFLVLTRKKVVEDMSKKIGECFDIATYRHGTFTPLIGDHEMISIEPKTNNQEK